MAALGLMLLVGSGMSGEAKVRAQSNCAPALVSFYSAEDYPGRTSDGTSTIGALASGDWIAAGGSRYRLGDVVDVAGIGRYRIADRGYLSPDQIDILVWTTAEALQWGTRRVMVCVE